MKWCPFVFTNTLKPFLFTLIVNVIYFNANIVCVHFTIWLVLTMYKANIIYYPVVFYDIPTKMIVCA